MSATQALQPKGAHDIDEAWIRNELVAIEGPNPIRMAKFGGYTRAALPLYTRILTDPDEGPVRVAGTLWFLTQLELPRERDEFAELAVGKLTHERTVVRLAAVQLLGKIGSARDASPIIALLSDRDIDVCHEAVRTLAVIGDRRTIVAMNVWLNSGDRRNDPLLRERVVRHRDELKNRLDNLPPLPVAPPPRPVGH